MPRVSVIMNCHNAGRYLRQALDSVYSQSFNDYEIILWDNLSTDASSEIALSYGAPLRYFRGDTFLSLGAARNAAIEKSQGEYIAFLDCDDIWLAGKLEQQTALLDASREVGLVYSDCYMINGDGVAAPKTFFATVKPARGKAFDKLFKIDFALMPTVVIRRDALDDVGPFDPHYQIAEDYDLWLRIADRWAIDFVEKPLAKYRVGCGGTARNQELAVEELLRIVRHWQDKRGNSGDFRGRARRRQASARVDLVLYHLRNRRTRKAARQLGELIKLFPDSLASLPALAAALGSLLKRRESTG